MGRTSGQLAQGETTIAAALRVLGLTRPPGAVHRLALLPLRLFLGITFIYAGLQKLTDPQFFSPTAPGFIGRQMSGFVHAHSPLSPLLTHLAIPHAAQFGALIAFCELWAGLSAVLGLVTRLGALGGLALSMTLYLTATWTVHPYFLGADLPYAMGWLTLMLSGPSPYSLDAYFFAATVPSTRTPPTAAPKARGKPVAPPVSATDPVTRHAFLRALGAVAAVVVGGGIVGGIAKLRTPNRVFAGTEPALASHSAAGAPSATAPAGAGGAPSAPAGYTFLGNVKVLPVNSAGQYADPISGDPALLVHLPDGHFVAYDAVCTHAGCTVEYDPTQHQLVCPCHGAVYDPAHGAQVLSGPTSQPLATLQVKIDARGNAYAQSTTSGAAATPAPGN